ncbi:MAG: pyruvate formate lyase-activating protein [Clostridia bacterium]|nr:pyruvate formate lyase-activating protein [Clostridia bacterium]
MKGRIHSIQSLGTVDGPGIRFVVFFQGCPLRCGYCHNPDTWDYKGGREIDSAEIIEKALRYKSYFGRDGGITLSGGEPLLQSDFAKAILVTAKESGLNTCVDTSGCVLNDAVKDALEYVDRVLLDIKFTTNEEYQRYVGCSLDKPLEFLKYLNEKNIPTTLRQVIVPTLNDNEENFVKLNEIIAKYECVDDVELLGFKKICKTKYDDMKIPFPFEIYSTPTKADIEELKKKIKIKK